MKNEKEIHTKIFVRDGRLRLGMGADHTKIDFHSLYTCAGESKFGRVSIVYACICVCGVCGVCVES